MADQRPTFSSGTRPVTRGPVKPTSTVPVTAKPGLHTVECDVCGAHTRPNGRGQRASLHKQLRVRARLDQHGNTVADVYESDDWCNGGRLAPAKWTSPHNAMSHTMRGRILGNDPTAAPAANPKEVQP